VISEVTNQFTRIFHQREGREEAQREKTVRDRQPARKVPMLHVRTIERENEKARQRREERKGREEGWNKCSNKEKTEEKAGEMRGNIAERIQER
jgi:hypothetical protein